MSIKIKRAAGSIVFFMLLFATLAWVQEVVTPDFDWPEHNRRSLKSIRSVFNEPKGSIDAVFFGTSQTFCSISPMTMYDIAGVRAYNMASTNQRIPVAYHLLKAILRDQTPKLVVVDASGFFYTEKEMQSAAKYEEMVNSLPWSKIRDRWALMTEIAKQQDRENDFKYILSSIIPLIRYHSNYLLREQDYVEMYLKDLYQRKGYVATYDFVPVEKENYKIVKAMLDPNDNYASDDDRKEKLRDSLEANEPYLLKMQQLCREHGAELVFIKVPVCTTTEHRGYWSFNKHEMTEALAGKMGVKFLDMCYEDIGLDWFRDSSDSGEHVNYRGTKKITASVLGWLQEEFGLSSEPNELWDRQWSYQNEVFAEEMEYLELELEYDLVKYLERVREGDYVLFTIVSNGLGKYWSDEAQQAFEETTGTKLDLRKKKNAAYVGISSQGGIIEERNGKKTCSIQVDLENGLNCKLSSKRTKSRYAGSIVIDGERYDSPGQGVHFVVYDNKLGCVVDSVCFNTASKSLKAQQNTDYKLSMRTKIIEYVHGQMKGI